MEARRKRTSANLSLREVLEGDDLLDGLQSTANEAGVSLEYALRAAVLTFLDASADDFMSDPQSLRFRFPTDEEEMQLASAGGLQALLAPEEWKLTDEGPVPVTRRAGKAAAAWIEDVCASEEAGISPDKVFARQNEQFLNALTSSVEPFLAKEERRQKRTQEKTEVDQFLALLEVDLNEGEQP